MCVYMHSRFVENHPIRILEDGPLIFEVVLSQGVIGAAGQAGLEGKGGRWATAGPERNVGRWAAAGPKSLLGLKSTEVKENQF
jgi:hypothetical protein